MLGVIGDLVEDIVVWLDEPVRHGFDTGAVIRRVRGGSAANVALFAAPRHPTRFFGCVGDDASGDGAVRELERGGVDVRVQRRGRTGTIVVLIGVDGERSMIPDRGASLQVRAIDPGELAGIELLHVPSYGFEGAELLPQTLETVARARTLGIRLSIDASSVGMIEKFGIDRYRALIDGLRPDLYFANRDEAVLLGLDTAEFRMPPETTLVLKNGPAPARVRRAGQDDVVVPVPPVDEVRDSTGAGDAFAAGFLTHVLSHPGDLEGACASGHVLAASVLRSPGASLAP